MLDDPSIPIIVGHSHCSSLGVPLQFSRLESALVPLKVDDPRFCGFSGPWPRTQKFWSCLATNAYNRIVILVWQGNQHNSAFLLSAGQRIDFVLHEESGLPIDPDAEIIPDLAMHQRLAGGTNELGATIQMLQAAGAARIIVCGTPPPKSNQDVVRRGVIAETAFQRAAERLGLRLEDIPLSSPMFMYKTWRVVQRHLQQTAHRHAIEFVGVPAASMRDGFLREEFSANDATHANAEFGQIMRDHLYVTLNGGGS